MAFQVTYIGWDMTSNNLEQGFMFKDFISDLLKNGIYPRLVL